MGNRLFRSSRFAHSSICVVIGLAALASYAGCSSSGSPSTPDPDAGSDVTQPPDTSPPIDAEVDTQPEPDAADTSSPQADCEDAGTGLPSELRCTGLYAAWDTKTLSSAVR